MKNILIYKTWFVLPGVFEQLPYPNSVNGSLRTLTYEVRCYLVLMVLGLLNIFRRQGLTLYLFMKFFALLTLDWISMTLASYFFVGSLIYVLRDKIPMQRLYAMISLIAIALSLYIGKGLTQVLIV